jgi:hypothetical protein
VPTVIGALASEIAIPGYRIGFVLAVVVKPVLDSLASWSEVQVVFVPVPIAETVNIV